MKKITPEKLEKLSDEELADLKKEVLLRAGFQLMAIGEMEPGEERVDARVGVHVPGSDLYMVSSEGWRRIMTRHNQPQQGELASAHIPGIGSGITFTSPEYEAAEAAMRAENEAWSGPIQAAENEIALLALAVKERDQCEVARSGLIFPVAIISET